MSAISFDPQASSVSFYEKIGLSKAFQHMRALAKRIGEAIKHCFSRLASLFSRPEKPVQAQVLKLSSSPAAAPAPSPNLAVPLHPAPSNSPSIPASVESSPVSVAISEVSKDSRGPAPFHLPPLPVIPSMPSSPAPAASSPVQVSDSEDALSGLNAIPSPSALDVQKAHLFSEQAQGDGICWASLCSGFFALQFMADRILKQLPVFTVYDQEHIEDQGISISVHLEKKDISLAAVETAFERIELPQGKDLIIEPYKPVALEKGTLCFRRNAEQNSLSEGIIQARVLAKNSDSHLAGVILVTRTQKGLPRVFSLLIHHDQTGKEAPAKKDRRHLHIASHMGASKMYVYDSANKLPMKKIDKESDVYEAIRKKDPEEEDPNKDIRKKAPQELPCELFLYQIRIEPKTNQTE